MCAMLNGGGGGGSVGEVYLVEVEVEAEWMDDLFEETLE